MKNITLFLLLCVALCSCQKEAIDDNLIIIEPPVPHLISKDSISTGQLWGITIGQNATDIYSTLQNISTEKRITNLGIVGNVFTSLDPIQNSIPLYTTLFLDESKGTETGVQISFKDEKVNAIFNNNGNKLSQWPTTLSKTAAIAIGDAASSVHAKLVNIKSMSAFANKFERISLFNKDVNKAYDANMTSSPQWYFGSPVTDKRYYIVHLYFNAGKLSSIVSKLYESQ